MLDQYNRNIIYMRISVIDRCNLSCKYCKPKDEIPYIPEYDILSVQEIHEVVHTLVPYGIRKIRLTGGEPLLRKDIVKIVASIASIPGIDDIGLTTNGILLSKYAAKLQEAGLKRVNISLDTMNKIKYNDITSGGNLSHVLKAIESAKDAGLDPIKINCVQTENFSGSDKIELENFCSENGLSLRYIRQMNLEKGSFWPVEGGDGGNCGICNRIRLTSNGLFKPCLFSDKEYSIRREGIVKAFLSALSNKPRCGERSLTNRFSQIGG